MREGWTATGRGMEKVKRFNFTADLILRLNPVQIPILSSQLIP